MPSHVTWDQLHSTSELLASEAEAAIRAGKQEPAERLYRQAAAAEADALHQLPEEKTRTRGITAVSSVALWYKGRDYDAAERKAHTELATPNLPSFAQEQLRDLLHLIWAAQSAEAAGISTEQPS
jgi:hypothetical protein